MPAACPQQLQGRAATGPRTLLLGDLSAFSQVGAAGRRRMPRGAEDVATVAGTSATTTPPPGGRRPRELPPRDGFHVKRGPPPSSRRRQASRPLIQPRRDRST